jgi:catechol 2,3-dioxygenase-like lactoylglutathione lyase family enzyme
MPAEQKLILGQVAYITDQVDVHETGRWYREVLGFLPSGATDKFGGPDLANLQGLSDPDCALSIVWMVERNDSFQLELFEYVRPESTPRPAGWTPRDLGYNLTTLYVTDFEGTVERAREAGSPTGGPIGEAGSRRAVVTDPNGIVLELLEQDIPTPGAGAPARPEVGVAVRSIRASVGDLEKSLAYFVDGFGLEEVDIALHRPEHEALWGLDGATPEVRVLAAGEVFLELAQYSDPAGAPFPEGYELCDGGVMNIALSTTSREVQEEVRDRIVAAGHQSRDFAPSDDVSVSYVTDGQGFNVELLYMAPAAYADFGYVPVEADGTASTGN